MKKLLLSLCIMTAINPVTAEETWPQESAEQVERQQIMQGISRITSQLCGPGDKASSPCIKSAIAQYLKSLNTPLSYKIYEEMISNNDLPISARSEASTHMKNNHSQQLQEILQKAIMNDSSEDIKKAIKIGADINQEINGKSPLFLAVILKKNNSVEELLNLGAKPNEIYLEQKLVFHAIKLGNIKGATLLIKKGADFSGPIDHGVQFHSQNAVTYILSRFDIAADGILELLQEIINHGFNIRGANHSTSAWDTAICYNKDIINFLIKNDANPNQIILKDKEIWTPLLIAVEYFNIEVVRYLLEAGADINLSGSPLWHGKQTPLSYAILKGDSSMAEFLLSNGATL